MKKAIKWRRFCLPNLSITTIFTNVINNKSNQYIKTMDIKNILINKISPSPINPRKSFDGAACPDEKSGNVININDAYKMKSMIPFLTNN